VLISQGCVGNPIVNQAVATGSVRFVKHRPWWSYDSSTPPEDDTGTDEEAADDDQPKFPHVVAPVAEHLISSRRTRPSMALVQPSTAERDLFQCSGDCQGDRRFILTLTPLFDGVYLFRRANERADSHDRGTHNAALTMLEMRARYRLSGSCGWVVKRM